jgi:hypothetical protein
MPSRAPASNATLTSAADITYPAKAPIRAWPSAACSPTSATFRPPPSSRKFGRAKVPGAAAGDPVHWQVESYLEHQGASFVRRFDANSWLRITRAVDRFDLTARAAAGSLRSGQPGGPRHRLLERLALSDQRTAHAPRRRHRGGRQRRLP